MFVTLPPLAVPFPPALASTGARYWRAFHMTFPRPWFIASFKEGFGEGAICLQWGLASDVDLVDRIEHVGNERLVGLVCMIPPLDSPSGQWSSRDNGSIWRARDPEDGSVALVFRDLADRGFLASFRIESAENLVDRELVVDLLPNGVSQI